MKRSVARTFHCFGFGFSILFLIVALQSCGGGGSASEERGSCVPTNLQYRPQNNGVFLSWRPNCDKNTSISGYNFYIVEADKAPAEFPDGYGAPHNDTPYPGDTNPDRTTETAELKYLENGKSYLGAVRIVFPNGEVSKASNVVKFTAMRSGAISLVGRYKGEPDGFSFSSGDYVGADDGDNDLYFVSKPGGDYLGSPDKLSFGLRKSEFAKVGSFRDVTGSFGKQASGAVHDEIKIKQGDVVDIGLSGSGSARVFVKLLSGSGEERTVTLEWFYNPAGLVF